MVGKYSIPTDKSKTWELSERQAFIKVVKKWITTNINSLSRPMYDLIYSGVAGIVKKEHITQILTELFPFHCDVPSIVLDVIHALDAETAEDSEEQRQNLYQIIRAIDKILPESLFKERLEIETLQDVGKLKNRNFHTKFIRIKTKLYYKQKKFNLLREECEGYAKLITELNQECTDSFTSKNLLEATKSLIGCFNLDPNRVLDLIMEAFELRPDQSDIFVGLLRSFSEASCVVTEILGFKFAHFYRSKEDTPKSLYCLAALLLQREIIAMDDLYPWLMPSDTIIEKAWTAENENHKEAVKKINSTSLNKDKEKDKEETEQEMNSRKPSKNQKFGLCEALLSVGAWDLAESIIARLPPRCVLSQPTIASALCTLIHGIIEPLYKSKYTVPSLIPRSQVKTLNHPYVPQQAEQFLDLRKDVIPMLNHLGSALHTDPVLLYKLTRICKAALAECPGQDVKRPPDEGDSLYYDAIHLLDVVILPSLSYLEWNCSIAEEIWTLVKRFPYHIRYCLYSRWKNDTPNEDPRLLHKNTEALKQLKNLMKRISKENTKPAGRLLGKLTHACPGALFDYVLIQIQSYENLIGPVVESLKFLTSLSYDVLGYCIIERLAKTSADKDRFNTLPTISSFCAQVFKRYNIELTGLLQYVANQLKDKNCLDLLIVREVVVKMAGIEAAEEMTDEQLNALSGGELLKGEGGYFHQMRNTKKSSQRLKDALKEEDLGASLCLLMAQQRHCVVFKENDTTHLKLVGKLYDQCQDTLVQFGTFLGSSLSVDEYDSRFPTVNAMLMDFHVNADVAFFLARPTLNHAISLKYEAARKAHPNSKKLNLSQRQALYKDAVAAVMTPLVDSIRPLHPANVWDDLSPQFLVTFWSLSMYDLQVPNESYVKEITKLKQLALNTLDSKELNASKSKKEIERYNALVDKLHDERKKQTEHVDKVKYRLKHECNTWFPSPQQKSQKRESLKYFLQMCLFPRCVFTASDALYCARFIYVMHSLRVTNFPTILCLDRIICHAAHTVPLLTENEANRFGRFLCALLEIIMRWHGSSEVFNAECSNAPGFVTKYRHSNQDGNSVLTYENYRHVCHKWHYKLTRTIVMCLESKVYTQVRNALIVLIRILPHYPVMSRLAGIIDNRIEKVQQAEKTARPDLYVLATSYAALLKSKPPNIIRESDFHQMTPSAKKEKEKEKEREKEKEKERDREKDVKEMVVIDDIEKRGEKREREGRNEKSERRDVKIKSEKSSDNSTETFSKDSEKTKDSREKGKYHRERTRERKDEKPYKEERYVEKDDRYSSKDDGRYGGREQSYYADTGHYYEEARDLSSVSNSPTHSLDNGDGDRESKRRKVESSTSKSHRSPEWVEPSSSNDKADKKERSSRSKEKPERKIRKTSRKRERHSDELSPPPSPKFRKDDDIPVKMQQNGNSDLNEPSHRSKRVYAREKSPAFERDRERERSHDKPSRDKQRTETSKRR